MKESFPRYVMLKIRAISRFSLIFFSALVWGLVGCAGGGGGTTQTASATNFTLANSVLELDKTSATVTTVTASTVVLKGAPVLQPGQILVHNAVDATRFLRKVVSSVVTADSTTVTTGPAGVEDVFSEANILQKAPISGAMLTKLVPALPGITIAASREPNGRAGGPNGITINFANLRLKDDANNAICQVDGSLNLDAGIETILLKNGTSVSQFRVAPYVNASGILTARGRIGGSFSKEFPISLSLAIPVTPLGPLGINCTVQLMMKVDGTYTAEGLLKLTASVSAQEGIEYTSSGGWNTVQNFEKTLVMSPPTARASIEMDVSLVRPKIGADILGIGEVSVTADVVRVVGRLTAQTTPTPGFVVEALGDFNLTVGGRVRLGPVTLWSDSKSFALGRFNIIQPYLLSNLTASDTTIVYADLLFKSIHSMDGGGGGDHVIVTSPTYVFGPNICNRDGRVCFAKFNAAGRAELWVCSQTGSSQIKVTDGTLSVNHPTWNSSGDEIAFDASDTTGTKQVYVVNLASGSIRQLTSDTTSSRVPSWSADGSTIYFEHITLIKTKVIARTSSASPTYDIVLANDVTSYSDPSMSPNGIQLVCIRGGSEVVVSDERGNGEHVIFADPHLSRPSFSPDGLRVLAQYNNVNTINVVSYDLRGQGGVSYATGTQPNWGMHR